MSPDYAQPDFYRFNSDSIELIRWIAEKKLNPTSILDLGAGSGILGIELARIFAPQRLVLVELQEEFEHYLKGNAQKLLSAPVRSEIVISSFADYIPQDQFDLIVSNPPYYLPGHGEIPKDLRRALARTFLQDCWSDLLRVMERSLLPQGKAFIVLKKDLRMLEMVRGQARSWGLDVICHNLESVMILELLTLNKK